MQRLLDGAGFREVSVFVMDDSFTVEGASAPEARDNLLRHLHSMYGLVKLSVADARGLAEIEALARGTLGEIRVEAKGDRFEAAVARLALVAVGTK